MSSDASQRVQSGRSTGRRRVWLSLWIVYLLALAGSHAWQLVRPPPTGTPAQATVEGDAHAFTCPEFDDAGPVEGPLLRFVYREWGSGGADSSVPLILIHGSPGGGDDFSKLGPLLAAHGRRVLAPDLPGFGASTRRPVSYSTRAHARAVLAMMDHLGIRHAHLLGWSMGGGVVLNIADIAPDRVASITMLAAIGDQSVEASGSYFFEHAKYTLGRVALLGANAALPSFGLLSDPHDSMAYSTLRNFGDTDMRPLRAVMEHLQAPTLIIAGRDDFLVQLRAPKLHHQLIRPSRLVVMDAMHFMPFLQADHTAQLVNEFIDHDGKGGGGGARVTLERSEVWEVPERTPPFGAIGKWGAKAIDAAPWWMLAALIALFASRRPFAAAAIAVALINALLVDWAVGLFGVFAGTLGRQMWSLIRGTRARRIGSVEGVSRPDWQRRIARSAPGFWLAWRAIFRPDFVETAPRAIGLLGSTFQIARYLAGALLAAAMWTFVACLPLMIIAALIALRLRENLGWAGTALSVLTLWLWARSFPLLVTWTGRRMLFARVTRLRRHEYWPSWLFYAPLVPWMLWLSLRHRHPLAFSACNPGIERGGGLIGESKCGVMAHVNAPAGMILDAVLIDEHESPEHRARVARAHIGAEHAVGAFPVIVKPDAGLRGFGVRLVRRPDELEEYFREMTRPAIVQRYHPGPHEVGVLWARNLNGQAQPGAGMIYSITRKDFPFVVGDGKHTLEQLIYRHPRHRCQAATFLARLADDASRVIPSGERVRLAQSGNHCQGTLFRDGVDLITPELVAVMDRLSFTFAADSHNDPDAPGGLDIGRFDLRFESEDDLRAGRNFGIIELNGTTGESTNLYDPRKSLLWAYRVLFGQWRLLYELGAWRRSRGVRAWTLIQLVRSLREFYRDRPGSSIAD